MPNNPLEKSKKAKRMRPGELLRCKATLHRFKNAVIHQLNCNKLKGKIPKLKEILERAIAKAE